MWPLMAKEERQLRRQEMQFKAGAILTTISSMSSVCNQWDDSYRREHPYRDGLSKQRGFQVKYEKNTFSKLCPKFVLHPIPEKNIFGKRVVQIWS